MREILEWCNVDRMRHNEIVEAVRLAVQSYAAGENSYRSSNVKPLDGPAA